jgi:hypothetical protein
VEEWAEAAPPPSAERLILAYFSPTCSLCSPLMGSLRSLQPTLRQEEYLLLVTDADLRRAEEYLSSKRLEAPVVARPTALAESRVPGAPYVVVTDRSGTVISAGGVNSLEQIELVVSAASDKPTGDRAVAGEDQRTVALS